MEDYLKNININMKTDICYNCGAENGLHQSETNKCPKNGRELPMHLWERGERQQWEETVFEDSGIRKLHDAAPELLEALIKIKKLIGVNAASELGLIINNAIKKAT